MRPAFLAFAGLASMLAACSGWSSHAGGMLPASLSRARAIAPALKPTPTPAVPTFKTVEHTTISRSGWTAVNLTTGFSAAIAPGRDNVSARTYAYFVSTNTNPIMVPVPAKSMSPLLYSAVTVSRSVIIASGSQFRYTLPASYINSSLKYYVAAFDPTNSSGQWTILTQAAKANGNTLTMAARATLIVAAALPYDFALVASSQTFPSPAPQQRYELTGSMTQTYTYAFPSPYASAVPQPPVTYTWNVHEYVVTSSLPAPPPNVRAGGATLQSAHTIEIDRSQNTATTSSSYSYFAMLGVGTVLYGTTVYDFQPLSSTPSTTTTAYAKPLLFAPAHLTRWTNSPAATIQQNFVGGQTYQRTVAADGAYAESGTIPDPNGVQKLVSIVENANGSGQYSGPFKDGFCAYSFGTPAPLGSPPVSAIKIVGSKWSGAAGTSPCGPLTRVAATPPAWFPPPQVSPSPSTSPALYAESDRSSSATTPGACGAAKGVSATKITRAIWQLDTIVGYSEFTTITTYRNASGVTICAMLADTLNDYYDWKGDTHRPADAPLFTANGQPVTVVTTSETLSKASSGGSAAPASIGEAVQSHFITRLARIRAALVRGRLQK